MSISSSVQPVPLFSSRRKAGMVAFAAVVLLVGIRAVCEFVMMSAFGSDPQLGIWRVELVVKLAFWLTIGGVLGWCLVGMWPKRKRIFAALLLVWAVAICWASWQYQSAGRALRDASNPMTRPERLSALVQFHGIQAGYQLDNRLAANPNTSADSLRELYQRDQLGTQIAIAENPHTPKDLLEKLAHHTDERVRDSLKRNPTLPKALKVANASAK